jgi:hypothetical protein
MREVLYHSFSNEVAKSSLRGWIAKASLCFLELNNVVCISSILAINAPSTPCKVVCSWKSLVMQSSRPRSCSSRICLDKFIRMRSIRHHEDYDKLDACKQF